MRIMLVTLALSLVLTAPAEARRIVLAAYGEGATTCTITLFQAHKPFSPKWDIGGRTECSAPLQQTGEAWLPDDWDSYREYGALCSGFRTACESGLYFFEGSSSSWGQVHYQVSLTAPRGQGWGYAPVEECSGVGTDILRCTFVADATTTHVKP
jgi:hypothetical protein